MSQETDKSVQGQDHPPAGQPDAGKPDAGKATLLGTSDAPKASETVPEKYEDFKLPDGVELDEKELEAFTGFAKELGLSQAQAQKLLERDIATRDAVAKQIEAEADAAVKQWADAARADKEFGGEKLDENLAVAKKALEAFGTPELKAMLAQSGLGNHPEAIRFMYRVGRAISEDKIVVGGKAPAPKRFYSNSDHVV